MIKRLGEINSRKSLQKLVYFLEAAGVPLEYDFRMHFYGPYSEELTYDIPDLEAEGVLIADETSRDWTIYKPGEKVDVYLRELSEQFSRYKKRIDEILDELGQEFPEELELIATTHKIAADLKELGEVEESVITRNVIAIKNGKFTEAQVQDALEKLAKANLL
jgi:uncharacterized protein YwgA